MRHLGRHADAFAQRGVRVDGLADGHGVGTHLDGAATVARRVRDASVDGDQLTAQQGRGNGGASTAQPRCLSPQSK